MIDADIQRLLATEFAAPEAATPDVLALREAMESAPLRLGGDPEPIADVRDLQAGHGRGRPVPVRLYRPTLERPRPLVLYAHGGGWVTGSLDSHDRLCRILANRMDALVCAVDYRRAPEFRYPAALDDFDAAWHWCVEEARALGADPHALAVAGDSAGAQLATALTLRLQARREALPVLQVLIYPTLDASTAQGSHERYASGYNLSARMMRWYWQSYAADASRDDPELSPLAAPHLAGLPPAVLAVAEADVLRDEGLLYAKRLAAAGVPVDLIDCTGMIHGFARWTGAVPAARAHLATICRTARQRLHAPRARG